MRTFRSSTFFQASIVIFYSLTIVPSPARAHWCTNIFGTPSRIVVKPERSAVFVSDTIGATETINVTVRNNFPYVISGVNLSGDNSDFTVSASPSNAVIQPAEDKKFVLTLTRRANGGDDNLYLKISIARHFPGNPHDITDSYFTKLLPTQAEINNSEGQATPLKWAKFAELESTYPSAQGLKTMLEKYGYHRLLYTSSGGYDGSWHVSQHPLDRNGFDFWMFDFAGAQRGLMSLAILQLSDPRIQEAYLVGMDDPMPLWRGMCAILAAAFTPGDNVRTRIETMATTDACVRNENCSNYTAQYNPSDDAKMLAKSALLILGQNQYQSEVSTYCNGGNDWHSYLCATALGISGDDAPVTDILLPHSVDSDSDELNLFASYLVNLVAAKRRGPAGTGCVSFFGEQCIVDNTAPRAPENLKVRPAS